MRIELFPQISYVAIMFLVISPFTLHFLHTSPPLSPPPPTNHPTNLPPLSSPPKIPRQKPSHPTPLLLLPMPLPPAERPLPPHRSHVRQPPNRRPFQTAHSLLPLPPLPPSPPPQRRLPPPDPLQRGRAVRLRPRARPSADVRAAEEPAETGRAGRGGVAQRGHGRAVCRFPYAL